MATATGNEAQEAIETIAEAVGETSALEAQLEAAEAATEAAEDAAEAIAEAAMEAERMRVVEQLRKDAETWRDQAQSEIQSLHSAMAALAATVREALATLAMPPEVKVEVTATPAADQSLIPAPSPDQPHQVTVTVDPSEGADARPALPPAPAKARPRWL